MIKRSTWFLLAVLLLAVGAYFLLKNRTPAAPEATPTETTPANKYLFSESDGALSSLRIFNREYHIVEVERSDGVWMVNLPTPALADQALAEAAATQVGAMTILDELDPSIDPGAIGLKFPAYTIKLTFQSGIKHILKVGNKTPSGSGYYVNLDEGIVYMVSTSSIDSLLNLLTTPPYRPTETPTSTMEPVIEAITPTP